jgi:hypothetical protein
LEPENPDGRAEHGSTRPNSPLGRGLHDVSHLFLSGPPAAGPAERAKDDGHEAPRLLHGCPAPDRQQLVSFLGRHIEALEAGLQALDASLPCESCGEIDLLAVDGGHRLAIVDLETGADDRLLLRGLAHFDWMIRNVFTLRRMYQGSAIDFSLRPRVFLVAPRLSWMVRCAARQIGAPKISWCTYRAVALGDGVGVVIDSERVGA